MIWYAWSPSIRKSSAPCTLTTCGIDQSAAVNNRLAGAGTPSPAGEPESAIVTGAVGAASRTTLNEALSPASLVTRPAVGVTTMPAASRDRNAAENSDVFMAPSAVAVAEIHSPGSTGAEIGRA